MESFRRSRLSIARYRILKESKLQLCQYIESNENQELLKWDALEQKERRSDA